jgi:glutamate formiminotransferase
MDRIVAAARSVEHVRVLDVHSDPDHNRSVLTLVGPPDAVAAATFRATAVATDLIDLRVHEGRHPRVGATDVVPFVPISGMTMEQAIELARAFGARVADELGIPVYFYEGAATGDARRNLENVRRKGFEELREQIAAQEDRAPDLGPRRVHESAGAVIVGARGPLIAYNIDLATTDLRIARAIARTVRHSSGGLRYVKALGLDIPARGRVQVSMNLTDYTRTAVHTVFNLVKSEAEAYGVAVAESEVVGLIPLDALLEAARHSLRLHHFDRRQVLEIRLMEPEE